MIDSKIDDKYKLLLLLCKKKQPEVMEKEIGTEVILFRFVDNYLHYFLWVVTCVCKELIFYQGK
jgi:hypothetical protein